jgi:CubicO group peptidase (beta-lactamase class C family)
MRLVRIGLVLLVTLLVTLGVLVPGPASAGHEDEGALQRALERFVSSEGGGPPGIIVVVTRGKLIDVHTAGFANLESRRPIHIADKPSSFAPGTLHHPFSTSKK